MKLIPARYVAEHPVTLRPGGGRLQNADGTYRASTLIQKGDVVLMPEAEVLGQTHLLEAKGSGNVRYLGPGRVFAMPEHANLSDEELESLGYEFSLGRLDFETVPDEATPPVDASLPTQEG